MPTLMRIFGFLRMPVRVNSYKFKKKISPPPSKFSEKNFDYFGKFRRRCICAFRTEAGMS